MDERLFREWFWRALGDFIDISYYPPELDKLKTDTYFGFNAVLESDECKKTFLEKLEQEEVEFINYICTDCSRHFFFELGRTVCPECGGSLAY